MGQIIKNIEHQKAVELTELVQYQQGQIVSRTLAQNRSVSITLFAFDKDEEISSHDSNGDALVYVLEGSAKLIIGGEEFFPQAGEAIVMPAGIPHAVFAKERFKMLLTVVFPAMA